jgi:hypothetical protein
VGVKYGQTGHIGGLARPQHPLPTTRLTHTPPPTSTGRPQAFLRRCSGVSGVSLRVFQPFQTFLSRRFSTEY